MTIHHRSDSTARIGLPFYAALFSFAHLARCAAAILLRPAAEMVRLGLAVLCLAHRAFCAKLILRRAAADMVWWRDAPLELTLPKAARAASIRCTSLCTRSRSFFNCWTTMDRFRILCLPSADDVNRPGGTADPELGRRGKQGRHPRQ